MNILNCTLIIISSIVCVISIILHYAQKENMLIKCNFFKNKEKYIFMILLALFCFTIFYKINLVPHGLHVDEAGALYDAICLAKNGADRYMNKYPVYLINFGGGQSALLAYLTAIIIKIIGVHNVCIRLPSIFLSIFALICLYESVKKTKSAQEALMVAFIYVICPWNIMKSRWGLDCNLLSSMMIIWICFFYQSVCMRKKYMWIITGILIGLTLYSYAISYILIPIILLVLCLYLLITKNAKISEIFLMGIPVAILAFPLILTIAYNSEWIENVDLPIITIPKLWNFRIGEISIKNISSNLKKILIILFAHDGLNYNSISDFGTIYYMSIPIFLIGLIKSIIQTIKDFRSKKFSVDIAITITFILIFLISLLIVDININRINAIYIFMIYFIGNGLYFIFEKTKIGYGIVIICYIIISSVFEKYYFTDFANQTQSYFELDIIYATQLVEEKNVEKVYVDDYSYIYTLVGNRLDVNEFNNTYVRVPDGIHAYGKYVFSLYDDSEINENAAYIIRVFNEFADDDATIKKKKLFEELESKGFTNENIGNLYVLWKE